MIYDETDYDGLKEQNLPLETEVICDEENGVVLAYNGLWDSVFELGTEESNLLLAYWDAEKAILGKLKMEKISFSMPDNLPEYLGFGAYLEQDSETAIQFKKAIE